MIIGDEKTLAKITAWMNPDFEESPTGTLVLTPTAISFWERSLFGKGQKLWYASHGSIARIYSWRGGLFFKNRITVEVHRGNFDNQVDSVTFRVSGGGYADSFLDEVRRHLRQA